MTVCNQTNKYSKQNYTIQLLNRHPGVAKANALCHETLDERLHQTSLNAAASCRGTRTRRRQSHQFPFVRQKVNLNHLRNLVEHHDLHRQNSLLHGPAHDKHDMICFTILQTTTHQTESWIFSKGGRPPSRSTWDRNTLSEMAASPQDKLVWLGPGCGYRWV